MGRDASNLWLLARAKWLLTRIDVTELATGMLPLQDNGENLQGTCPFHVVEDECPTFSVNPKKGSFYCYGCGVKGDMFDLVGHFRGLGGVQAQVDAVEAWRRSGFRRDRPNPLVSPQVSLDGSPSASEAPTPMPVVAEELSRLWSRCSAVTEDCGVSEYLKSCGLEPEAVAARDLARALPKGVELPSWTPFRPAPWRRSEHAIVARLFDSQGRLAALITCLIDKGSEPALASVFPPGPQAGLLLADDAAQSALRTPQDYQRDQLWIAEGLVNHLLAACQFPPESDWSPGSIATFDRTSWTKAAAERIPAQVTVVVAFDDDGEGEAAALDIRKSFEPRRMNFERWIPRKARSAS